MTSKVEQRDKIIDGIWKSFSQSKSRTKIHIIMENWADVINENLIKENIKLKEENEKLKNGR